jgi:hypothetical protein
MADTGSTYEIRIRNHLDESWLDLFADISVTNQEKGEAVIRMTVDDRALLHGVLARIRDLNLDLISVQKINDRQEKDDE